MRTISTIAVWTCLLSLCLLSGYAGGQGSDDKMGQTEVSDGGSEETLTPLEQGMRPFYMMTNYFIWLIQTKDNNTLLDKLDDKLNLSRAIDSINLNNVQDELVMNWEDYSILLIGYAVCVAIGIVFIICMPIVGCCFMCCRLCGKCGGTVDPKEGRLHKWHQLICGVLLFLFTTVMLVGVVFAFMTNQQLRSRLSAEPEGACGQLGGGLRSFNSSIDLLVADIRNVIEDGTEEQFDSVITRLRGLPSEVLTHINATVPVASILKDALSIGESIPSLKKLLMYVDGNQTMLVNSLTTLTSELQAVRDDTVAALNGCNMQDCNELRTSVMDLQVNIDFSQQTQTVKDQLDNVNGLDSVIQEVKDRQAEYEDIKNRFSLENDIQRIQEKKNQVLTTINTHFDSFEAEKNKFLGFLGPINQFTDDECGKQLDQYGLYVWAAGIGLCCVFLLIVLCYYLGLLFGLRDDSYPGESCGKSVGANLIMASVGFSFLFSWLLMLVCTVTFMVGSVMQGEVCRHVTPELSSSVSSLLDNTIQQPSAGSVSFSDALRRCRENQAIYSALNGQTFLPLDDIFSDTEMNIQNELQQLDSLSIDLSSVTIINADTRRILGEIRDSDIDNIDFSAFYDELNKPTTTVNLDDVITKMTDLSTALRAGGQAATANELDAQKDELNRIKSGTLATVTATKADLRKSLDDLDSLIGTLKGTAGSFSQRISNLIASLDTAQVNLRGINLNTFFNNVVGDIDQQITNFISDLKMKVTTTAGRCGNAYTQVIKIVDVACVDVLQPFNGFWFSFGWCLAFFIPAIIAGVHLAGTYRKTEDYEPSDKYLEDPNFDAYSGGIYPGDNIPLEDRRKYRPLPGGSDLRDNNGQRQGLPNTAYQTDNYPPGRPPVPSAPYNDDYNRDKFSRNGGPPAYQPYSRGYGGVGGSQQGATPPNPPHYYNNRAAAY